MALGALHGPAEVLPVSSSGHTTAVPWLLGSDYADVDPELRKAVEVALHAGAGVGLLLGLGPGPRDRLRAPSRRHLLVLAAASAPAGVAGLLLERRIESTLGTPASIAGGLLAGSLAMVLADRRPQLRRSEEAELSDAMWLGVAQATSLIPGVSRGGATLAAARWRRFRRQDAGRLSAELAGPVITGAALLKAWRLRQGRLRMHTALLATGAATSCLSTLLATRLRRRTSSGSLLPYAIYRTALAGLILLRLRLGRPAHEQGHPRRAW